jgi:transglutaminase-like putative cysteine protease
MRNILLFLFLLFQIGPATIYSQDYAISSIDPNLLSNANAIVRNETVEISILAVDKMSVKTRRVVTVLNEYGEQHVQAYDVYDENSKIKDQEVIVYNSNGEQIEKMKARDFDDRSINGSGTLFSDNRLSYLNYTIKDYPITIAYESEVETNSTIFIQPWKPLGSYNLSVEQAAYKLLNPEAIPFRFEERNLENLDLQKNNSALALFYEARNISAVKNEVLSPELSTYTPQLLVALNEFALVGVQGKATNWKELGKWQYDYLLRGKTTLPEKTILKLIKLTANATSDREKAEIVYNYVQENTRYISVQLGIGGWEPMTAKEVDRLGYGDCKALTNYTKALLESQNIPSYYTVVYGGKKNNIDSEFASMQGNHVILNLPLAEEDVWLECTSQSTPFNYLGDFTDDRKALKITPEGGEIISTPNYATEANLKESLCEIELNDDGGFSAEITIKNSGIPYGNIYGIRNQKEAYQKIYYLEKWGRLKELKIEKIAFENNRDAVVFTENLEVKGVKLASKAGNRLLLPINFLPAKSLSLPRNESRKLPLVIERGGTFKDNFQFKLPAGFKVESIPEPVTIENDFGKLTLKTSIAGIDETELSVERLLVLKEGSWESSEYNAYREFMNQIKSYTNQKAVLVSN